MCFGIVPTRLVDMVGTSHSFDLYGLHSSGMFFWPGAAGGASNSKKRYSFGAGDTISILLNLDTEPPFADIWKPATTHQRLRIGHEGDDSEDEEYHFCFVSNSLGDSSTVVELTHGYRNT